MPSEERDKREAAPRPRSPDDVRPNEAGCDEVKTPPARPDPSPDDFPEG
jgi:hypothetical protein